MTNLKGSFRNLRIGSGGVKCERMSLRNRIRFWLMRKIDAVDREGAERFASEYLQPNGRAAHTVTRSPFSLFGGTIIVPDGKVGIAIAPWVREVVLEGNIFVGARRTVSNDPDNKPGGTA